MRADDNIDPLERFELLGFARITNEDGNVESGRVGVAEKAKKHRSPDVPCANHQFKKPSILVGYPPVTPVINMLVLPIIAMNVAKPWSFELLLNETWDIHITHQ